MPNGQHLRRGWAGRRAWALRSLGPGLLGLVLVSSAAKAESESELPLELEYDAPAECPSRDAIRDGVLSRVRHNSARPLQARARIRSENGRWRLHITFAGGERTVEGDSCSEVSLALTAMLALAIDPQAESPVAAFPELHREDSTRADEGLVDEALVPEALNQATPKDESTASGGQPRLSQPQPVPQPKTVLPAPQEVVTAVERSSQPTLRRIRVRASLLLLGEVGALPSPSVGPSIMGRVLAGAWSAELSASTLIPRRAGLADHPGKGGDISWWAGQLAGCWAPGARDSAWSWISACVGAEAGQMLGRGNVQFPTTAHTLWLAGTAATVIRIPWSSSWATEARLGLAVPVFRPLFGLDGYSEVAHQAFPVSGRVSIGIAWR